MLVAQSCPLQHSRLMLVSLPLQANFLAALGLLLTLAADQVRGMAQAKEGAYVNGALRLVRPSAAPGNLLLGSSASTAINSGCEQLTHIKLATR